MSARPVPCPQPKRTLAVGGEEFTNEALVGLDAIVMLVYSFYIKLLNFLSLMVYINLHLHFRKLSTNCYMQRSKAVRKTSIVIITYRPGLDYSISFVIKDL